MHLWLLIGGLLACLLSSAVPAAEAASGYFRMGGDELRLGHALAVVEEAVDPVDDRTLVFLTAVPVDPSPIAAAFDADAALRAQEPAGGYLRLCLDGEGNDCGMFYSPEGFNIGGYGELQLQRRDGEWIAGSFRLPEPGDFMGTPYQFDFSFDVALAHAPGDPLPAEGGEPGADYNRYLQALVDGDFARLRALSGDDALWRFPEDDPASARQSLKSARDGAPLRAQIVRGRVHGDQAVLWLHGTDRDGIARAGRVLMRKGAQGMAQAMQQQEGQGPGPNGRPGRSQRRAQQDTDPLGRPMRGHEYGDDTTVKVPGEIDAQRARRVLEELRRRYSDPQRPQMELDYIERLLKGF